MKNLFENSRQNTNLPKSGNQQDIETAIRAEKGEGKVLEELYQGFFGSKENCEMFASHIPNEMYARKDAMIVDAGSSQGTLGSYVRERFGENGSDARLVMVDTNAVAMKQSPVKAEKIEADLRETPLNNESADIVILRSVLQYAEPQDQVKILEEIKRILKPGGVLVSQFCSYETQEQADCFNGLFEVAKRKVNFCGKKEGIDLHGKIFDEIEEIADGPILHETFDEFFVERIQASEDQIQEAKKYIRQNIERLQGVLTQQEEPYAWQIPYTIVTCKKAESSVSEKEDIEEKFKESKVRREDGKLLAVYHFSDDDFDSFSLEFAGKNYEGDKGFFGLGAYFTGDEDAFHYGKRKYTAYLNLKNPLTLKNPSIEDIKNLHGKRQELIDQGYDGVMVWNDEIKDETKIIFGKPQLIKGRKAGWSELVVFDPKNIQIIEK